MVQFLEESSLLGEQAHDPDAAIELLESRRPGGRDARHRAASVDDDGAARQGRRGQDRLRAAPTASSATLFDSQEYRQLARVHAQLVELAGTPAFEVRLGDARESAPSFEALREAVMTVAQKGIKLQRFKGLGEMNAEQLGETTMDPATRTLAQVTLEDAVAADRIFSMLMGDQVEPRRAFIEDNARAVANLDV